ncbi:MAG: OB-fold domain-containing protein [Thermoleophilaceae bacterium]
MPAELSPAQVFAEYCERGVLAYQAGPSGEPFFYPRLVAPGGGEPEWRESAGRGTVHATTTVRRRGQEPHDISIVELDEGFRMMSRVDGVDPAGVRIGMRVQVRFETREDGPPIPVFVPEGA